MPDTLAKLLVVDDELNFVKLCQRILSNAGYEVSGVLHGEEAITLVRENVYDLLLTDIKMPQMDGFEVMRRIRENPLTAKIPIMVITAMWIGDEERERICREAQGFLQKGTFWIEDLLKEVARIVAQRSGAL